MQGAVWQSGVSKTTVLLRSGMQQGCGAQILWVYSCLSGPGQGAAQSEKCFIIIAHTNRADMQARESTACITCTAACACS